MGKTDQKKINFHLYTRPQSTPIRSKPIKKKSNFTCTLEHDQPPSDQKIRSKPIKKKSYFTCTLEHDQPPSDQNRSKKIKFHLYTRARSTPIRSKNPIKTDQKKIKFHLYTRPQSTPIRSKNPIKTDQKKNQISPVH